MSSQPPATPGAVFLSYAREDSEAARRIADALRAFGVDVWFDESELRGGDAWDAKIRNQIRDCTLFLPIISAQTQARREGYFRREWKQAVLRLDDIADSVPFLVPVVVDDTPERGALVPDAFRTVQWTRLPEGETPPALCARVQALLTGEAPPGPRTPSSAPNTGRPGAAAVPGTPQRGASRRWVAVGAVLLAFAAAAIWQPWRSRNAPLSNSPSTTSLPTSEVARLRARLVPDTWKKEDFEPWSAAIDRIIVAEEQNADAWALRSIINSLQVMRNFVAETKPLEIGRSAANRALHLAPDSPLAELALGMHHAAMISRGGDTQAARPHLRRAFDGLPADALTRYADLTTAWLGYDFDEIERSAKAWLKSDPAARFPAFILGQTGLVLRDHAAAIKWGEQAASDRDITGMRAFVVGFDAHYYLRGDLVAGRTMLDRIPTSAATAHRVLHARWLLAMAEGRWDTALLELARTPESIFYEGAYYGPKELLAGMAHQAAGRTEAALTQWREAEHLLREQLANDPQNEPLHAVLAVTLAYAGRPAEARNELAFVEPLARERPRSMYSGRMMVLLAQTHAALGQIDAMIYWLRKLLSGPVHIAFTPASLRVDPRFRSVIMKPEVQALLAEFAHLNGAPEGTVKLADKSIAVLAFENRSSEKDSEYFADGISEELLNVLAKVPGLLVIGRASSFQFKGKNEAPAKIGKELNVTHLVAGSVQRSGTRARITAQLTLAATGETLWSDKFDTELQDIFTAQDAIAAVIAQKLSLTLGTSARPAKTVNPEAHRLVLEGRYFWNLRNDEGFARAEADFGRAAQLDPQFAQAHAGLADVAVMRATYRMLDGETNVAEDIKRSREHGQRALALDPSLAEPHAALGYTLFLEHNFEAAELEYQKAFALRPNYSVAHMWRGVLKMGEGRIDVALDELEQAAALDPLSSIILHVWSENLALAGLNEQALEINERAMSLRHDVWPPFLGERTVLLWRKGRTTEAVAAARTVAKNWPLKPRWFADANAIWVLRQAGLNDEAAAHAQRLLQELPAQSNSHRGLVLAALGRSAEAIPPLERAGVMSWRALYWASFCADIRELPQFRSLMTKLGAAQNYELSRESLRRVQQKGAASP